MPDIPERFQRLRTDFPTVADAYERLGTAVHAAGPLDDKTRALVKLGISTGARLEGALHSHVRKCIKLGVTKEEIRQAVLLAMPTIGLPGTMAAMSWADDILDKAR